MRTQNYIFFKFQNKCYSGLKFLFQFQLIFLNYFFKMPLHLFLKEKNIIWIQFGTGPGGWDSWDSWDGWDGWDSWDQQINRPLEAQSA